MRTRSSAPSGQAAPQARAEQRPRQPPRPGPREGDEKRVSLGVDLVAAVLGEGLAQDALVLREHLAVALAQLLEQPRRPLDVREEEGDGADRQLGHSSRDGTPIA